MTTKNYDSEFCGRVPLNQTNMIQPHGVLVLVERKGAQVLQASENVEAVFGVGAPQFINTLFTDYISATQKDAFLKELEKDGGEKVPFTFTIGNNDKNKDYTALVQVFESYVMLELEIADGQDAPQPFVKVYQQLKPSITGIEAAENIEKAASIVAKELKRISGFDKVMIYQFDEEWNGTVIAEEMEAGMESYMGLKFPASDIPRSAREMYRTNPYRFIPDANAQPVRLYPVINPVTFGFTDLSNTNLRSVAGVHVEYLNNMKVTASMSTRIVKDGTLWGLISCHHRTARHLSYHTCSLFELLSDIISAKITALDHQLAARFKSGMHQLYSSVAEGIYGGQSLTDGLSSQHQDLLQLLNADGVAIVHQKEIKTFGKTPSNAAIEDLVFWLQSKGVSGLYHVASLSNVYEGAEGYAQQASGLLALPVQPDDGAFILAFRPEAVQQVAWGGNPNEAITFTPDKKGYHPRASFQQWQQTVDKQAVPWKPEELEIAENFRNLISVFPLSKM